MAKSGWRGGKRGRTHEPPRWEIILPFVPGSVVRVRYWNNDADLRLGSGAINIYSGSDIALHVNPRPKLDVLVLNSHINDGWGEEERPESYPLKEPGEVYLSVWAGPDGFFIQAQTSKSEAAFGYLYAYRLPETRTFDRITIDIGGLRAVSVQPEL